MNARYTIEYSLEPRKHSPPEHQFHYTDDPVSCVAFVQQTLEQGMALHAIRHDGADLPPAEFDRIAKVAAAGIAAKALCTSLRIKPEEERYRFGFSA